MGTIQVANVSRAPAKPGKRKTVVITVDFDGCLEDERGIMDPGKYRFAFTGDGVDPVKGDVDCPGAAGTVLEKQYVLRFIVAPGDNIQSVTFRKPFTLNSHEFKAGVGPCGDEDSDEFEDPQMINRGTQIVIRNKKKNSGLELGYRFKVWVTHLNGQVKEVSYDPRIINV